MAEASADLFAKYSAEDLVDVFHDCKLECIDGYVGCMFTKIVDYSRRLARMISFYRETEPPNRVLLPNIPRQSALNFRQV